MVLLTDMNNDDKTWYGIKYLVRDEENEFYEERTIILKANTSEEALDKGESHANEYCKAAGLEYTGYIENFQLVDDTIGEFTEVYSVMRYSDEPRDSYIENFLKTGDEVNLS